MAWHKSTLTQKQLLDEQHGLFYVPLILTEAQI